MGLLERMSAVRGRAAERSISSVDEYAAAVASYLNGYSGVQQTISGEPAERAPNDLVGYATQAYAANGPVFALMAVRGLVFSAVRMTYQRLSSAEMDLFGTRALAILEEPWPGGTTQDLLARMLLDADLAGNSYWVRQGDELVRLRPDWVDIVLEPRTFRGGTLGYRRIGYIYSEGGPSVGDPVPLLPDEVCHFAPHPDPLATYRGMSWLTPVIRELGNDRLMARHQQRFFENGAPQPLDAKVLTPSGWSTMGEMTIGSRVIGSDGLPHRVTGVYPQGEQEIYRVRFQDGGSTECTMDHLWTVTCAYDRKRGVSRTLPLRALVEGDGNFGDGAGRGGLRMPSGAAKWAVPMADPVEFDPQPPPPVDPYLLGLLLGDGSFRGNRRGGGQHGSITLAAAAEDADEIVERITPALPDDVSLNRRDRGGWSEVYFKGPGGPVANSLKQAIRDLGLWGKGSREKFIPRAYLVGSVKDRAALLQGLIDSDGSVETQQPNLVKYTTNSDRLAADVIALTQGLGGLASMNQHGNRDRWTVVVKRLPDEITPARLLRKASRYQPSTAARWRSIVDVEHVGVKRAQCIRVDVDDHLYVTDDYVLTHNTPNMIVKYAPEITPEKFAKIRQIIDAGHTGAENAYKTLHLGPGADATVVGANFQQMTFTDTQGRGETRLASAAGVPPVFVGFSEGLQGSSLNEGNFKAARRRFADATMHPLWARGAGSLARVMPREAGARLWYDGRQVPFLREDEKDAAEIQEIKARALRQLLDAGWKPDSARGAIVNDDWAALTHSGKFSVQLQADQPAIEPPAVEQGDDDEGTAP